MNDFLVHTLGCGSAKPSTRHQPSSTVVSHRSNLFMVDCGEGAQQMFQKMHLNFSRLNHIFITHLHGDHVLGLPGLVSTMGLSGIGGSLTIHTFEEGAEIMQKILDFFSRDMSFEVNFDIIKPEEKVIYESPALTVRTIPLNHRVPTVGYVFEEKPKLRHIIRDMCDFHGVPVFKMNAIKQGEDFVKEDGTVVPNHVLTSDPSPSYSYAHISDTAFMPELAEKIKGVDVLFHETTYLDDHKEDARLRGHSTAKQAAMVAKMAGAKKLLTGHYSSRYKSDEGFAREAREVFPNVVLNREGLVVAVGD